MICHKDKTFCPFTDCAKDCDRKITQIMGLKEPETGLPICVFSDKPECYTTKRKVLVVGENPVNSIAETVRILHKLKPED